MDRLSKEQWLDHGLEKLAEKGFTALKADTLSKSLGVSRGSFYWHFKNLKDFHQAVLQRWQDLYSTQTIQMLENSQERAKNKLEQLINLALSMDRSLEKAIRAWAMNNPEVETVVQQIDLSNLNYVASLVADMHPKSKTVQAKARIIYGSYLGQLVLGDVLSEAQTKQITKELLALAEP